MGVEAAFRACTVEWQPKLDAVVLRWSDFAEGEDYRDPMDAVIDVLDDHDGEKLLADSRELGVVADEAKQWTYEDWTPRAESAGLRYTATVYPEKVVGQMSVDDMDEQTSDNRIDHMVTDEVSETKQWLRSR